MSAVLILDRAIAPLTHSFLFWRGKWPAYGPYWRKWKFSGPQHPESRCANIANAVFAICVQQRRRSACASAQSDQHLCYSLLRWCNTSSFHIQNFKPLAILCRWDGQFETYRDADPKDRFSHEANIYIYIYVFQVSALKKLRIVGRHNLLF